MVLHAAFIQQRAADEQMAEINRAPIGRERRAMQREAAAERLDQRIGDRADIALIGAVEGRAILKEKLPRARPPQPVERRAGFAPPPIAPARCAT